MSEESRHTTTHPRRAMTRRARTKKRTKSNARKPDPEIESYVEALDDAMRRGECFRRGPWYPFETCSITMDIERALEENWTSEYRAERGENENRVVLPPAIGRVFRDDGLISIEVLTDEPDEHGTLEKAFATNNARLAHFNEHMKKEGGFRRVYEEMDSRRKICDDFLRELFSAPYDGSTYKQRLDKFVQRFEEAFPPEIRNQSQDFDFLCRGLMDSLYVVHRKFGDDSNEFQETLKVIMEKDVVNTLSMEEARLSFEIQDPHMELVELGLTPYRESLSLNGRYRREFSPEVQISPGYGTRDAHTVVSMQSFRLIACSRILREVRYYRDILQTHLNTAMKMGLVLPSQPKPPPREKRVKSLPPLDELIPRFGLRTQRRVPR